MRLRSSLAWAATLLGSVPQTHAADSVIYKDPLTGFSFSSFAGEYALGSTFTFRIATPSNATPAAPYDVVLQVVAPAAVGWAGLAWGGTMIKNPLTIAWSSGNTVVVSPRYTSTRTSPAIYSGSTLQPLPKGTFVNSTHWQYTTLCKGCTSYVGGSGNTNVVLNPQGQNRLAFAYSRYKPSGTSPSATLQVHEVTGYWTHDFAAAANSNFDALVKQNT